MVRQQFHWQEFSSSVIERNTNISIRVNREAFLAQDECVNRELHLITGKDPWLVTFFSINEHVMSFPSEKELIGFSMKSYGFRAADVLFIEDAHGIVKNVGHGRDLGSCQDAYEEQDGEDQYSENNHFV